MDHLEFSRRLAARQLPPVLFFEGPEEYLKQTALKDLRKALLPEGMEELNESRLNAPETDEIIAAAETLPFLADRRLIVIRDHPAVTGRGEADEKLLSYLPKVPPSAIVLFYNVLPVKQRKIRNVAEKMGGVVKFEPLKGAALTSFVTRSFQELGRECDAQTADFLIFTCGSDSNLLQSEIAKIAALHPDEKQVSPEDIKALATPSAESQVFQLVDAILAGNDAAAFSRLRELLLQGVARTVVLYMLTRQFRLMQHVKIMQYEKRGQKEIAAALGVSPYISQQYIRQAASYSGKQVKEAVRLCLDTDLAVKSGGLRDEGAVETVMLKLLQLKKTEKS